MQVFPTHLFCHGSVKRRKRQERKNVCGKEEKKESGIRQQSFLSCAGQNSSYHQGQPEPTATQPERVYNIKTEYQTILNPNKALAFNDPFATTIIIQDTHLGLLIQGDGILLIQK